MAWGARSFNGSSSDYITTANAAISALPITFAAWINTNSTSIFQTVLQVGQNSGAGAANDIYLILNTSNAVFCDSHVAGTFDGKGSSGTVSTNTWTHVGWSYASTGANGLKIYINGVLDSTQTFANGCPSVVNSTQAAVYINTSGSLSQNFSGSIADSAIWNIALTDLEFAALGKGIRPYVIRPTNLKLWWPLGGQQSPEPDLSGNKFNGTVNGTTAGFGAPFAPFTPRWPPFIPGAAGGGSSVVFRKTLSQIGGRVGSRQIDGYMNG